MEDSFEEDDVELIDYLRVIWCRRRLIFFGTVFSIVLAGGLSLILPKTYEASSLIQIGRVWSEEIEDTYFTKEIIGSEAFFSRIIEKLGLEITAQEMKKAEIIEVDIIEGGVKNNGETTPLLLLIRTRADDPKQAVSISETLADFLIEDHRVRFEQRLQEYKIYEKELVAEMSRINSAISELDRLIKLQMNPSVNASSVMLLQVQRRQKSNQLLDFKKELRDTRINNNFTVFTENTKIVSAPIMPERPVSPRIKLNMVVSGITGFLVTFIITFFLEYLGQVRVRESGQTD